MLSHEASGDKLVPAAHRNLPNRILRAIDNALHLGGLPRAVRNTLADICRFVPQASPFETVFAHKQKIAERTGASERTVYRHLGALQSSGLIEVLDQERKSRNGRFSVSRIRLTRRAAGLLGFIAMEENLFALDVKMAPSSEQAALIAAGTESKDHDTAIEIVEIEMPQEPSPADENSVMHNHPSANLSAGHTLSEPTVSKNHLASKDSSKSQKIKNGLPDDLAWLTGNGVSRAGVYKLMGLAKGKSKRLSDVVIVVKEYIKELTGGRLFAYLAGLCKGPTDFATAATLERKRITDQKDALVYERKSKIFRERFKATALTNRAQTRLYLIDAKAQFVQVLGGTRSGTAPLNDLKDWIAGIESGQLVLATLDLERQFSGVSF